MKSLPLNSDPEGHFPFSHWHSSNLSSRKFGTALIQATPSAHVHEQSVLGKMAKTEVVKK